jgi:hypothetical protein
MKIIFNKYKYLFLIFAISLIIFWPSLFVFFTNDDFFHLKIAQIQSLSDFLKFFYVSPEGWGLYRPVGTQVFYALGRYLFNMQPFWMHVILFGLFFLIIYLVQRLIFELTRNKILSFVAAFLYAVSATHFGQLYFLATQELWVGVFYLTSVLFFALYFKKKRTRLILFSLAAFILALMSKETAVSLPFVLILLYWFKCGLKDLKTIFRLAIPCWLILFIYFIFRLKFYGFTSGASYVWDFSARIVNTLGWYGLWSLNLPEMLIDFVGPGFKLNPNLLLYWSSQYRIIFVLFGLELAIILHVVITKLKDLKKSAKIYLFGMLWFVITLLPVLFLPLHKFTFYLTIPLLGIVLILGQLFSRQKIQTIIFGLVWLITSVATLSITRQTHWITQGEAVSRRVYDYFSQNKPSFIGKKIVFADTPDDASLPWSPTSVVRLALSENNFFKVFFPDLAARVFYTGKGDIIIESRQFLGY